MRRTDLARIDTRINKTGDPAHAAYIDDVGRRVTGHIRAALQVPDAEAAAGAAARAAAEVAAGPTRTPWNSLNASLEGPAGLQLTLFQKLAAPAGG